MVGFCLPTATVLAAAFVVLCSSTSAANERVQVNLIAWNLQSGNSSASKLAELAAQAVDVDLWGLSEVANKQVVNEFEQQLEQSTGADFDDAISQRGGADRLAILYRKDRFRQIGDYFEIDNIAVSSGLRPGFAVQLEEMESGQRFFFVVNHFKCCGGDGNIEKRKKQAQALNAFAVAQHIPVVTAGDFNTFYRINEQEIPPALAELTEEGPFTWIMPTHLVRTEDTGPTILDYVLVANPVAGWSARSDILSRNTMTPLTSDSGFSDDRQSTDHRPVLASFTLHPRSRIEELEEEIALLEAALSERRAELEHLLDSNP